MKRYFIKYSDYSVFEHLPRMADAGTAVWNIHKVPACAPEVDTDASIITVNAADGWIGILLSDGEVAELRARGITVTDGPRQQPQPLFNSYCYGLTENPRTERYFDGTATRDQPYNGYTITGEIKHTTAFYLGLDQLYRKGFTGQGVKVMVIDDTDMDNPGHADVPVAAYYDGQIMGNHALQMASIIGAPANGKGIVGIAPGCTLYFGSFYDPASAIAWGLLQGCRVFNLSFASYTYAYLDEMIKKAADAGCTVNIAAGNKGYNTTPEPINPMGGAPGSTVIGGMFGGGCDDFLELLRFSSSLPVNGKGIDFLLPVGCLSAGRPNFDLPFSQVSNAYYGSGGTSTACAVKSGLDAVYMSMLPDMPGRVLNEYLKIKSTKTVAGYPVPKI